MTFELLLHQVGEHVFFNVLRQSLGNLTANYLWIEETGEIIEWVVNHWWRAADLGNPQAMKFYVDY